MIKTKVKKAHQIVNKDAIACKLFIEDIGAKTIYEFINPVVINRKENNSTHGDCSIFEIQLFGHPFMIYVYAKEVHK